MNKNTNKKILMEQVDLFIEIQKLSKYYNEKTINYLMSLIHLEESVFKNFDFYEQFGELSSFYEIAKYNIYYRTISTIFNLSPLLSSEFVINKTDESLKIYYQDKFPIFDFMMIKQEKIKGEKLGPLITIYSVSDSLKDRIENIQSQINNLIKFGYYDDFNIEYNDYCKKRFIFGNFGSKKVSIYESRIDELNEKIEFLKSYGSIQRSICSFVTDKLLEDWNMTFSENEYIKTLSWIDIYKKKV